MAARDGAGALLAGPGLLGSGPNLGEAAEQVEIQLKYAGYISRQQDEIDRHAAFEHRPIPPDLDFDAIKSLSFEVRQQLNAARPETIGQAARVSGVTPAAISLLLIHLKRHGMGSMA